MSENKILDTMWDDNPIDITQEANFIWSIANKLRGSYMPDKYGDVVIPMTILRRFECALEATKQAVLKAYVKRLVFPQYNIGIPAHNDAILAHLRNARYYFLLLQQQLHL